MDVYSAVTSIVTGKDSWGWGPLSFSASGGLEDSGPSNELVSNMMDNVEIAVDEKIEESQLQLFTSSAPIKASQVQTEAGESEPGP